MNLLSISTCFRITNERFLNYYYQGIFNCEFQELDFLHFFSEVNQRKDFAFLGGIDNVYNKRIVLLY